MKKIFLAVFVIILIIFLIIINLYIGYSKKTTNNILQTPLSVDNAAPGYLETQQQGEADKKSYQIGLIVNKLPYSGKNFSLYYKFSTDEFILYLNPAVVTVGYEEFNVFLKQNGVDDKSWFPNLTVINKSATPVP